MAEALKTLGNEAFKNNDFAKAIEHFTEAIGIDGTNHVLYSNRSAARVRYIDETFFFFFSKRFSIVFISLSLSLCASLFFFFLFLERSCEGGACRAFY
jgi:predicted membrane protein